MSLSLEKQQLARAIGYLREAAEKLASAGATLHAAQRTEHARAVEVARAGIQTIAEAVEGSDEPICGNCGYTRMANHHPRLGTCLNGGIGEDATTYEPRPKDWTPPPPDPDIETLSGFTEV
jgi:molybdenum cofactor biosynthesis enzyme MoaA